jgi:hypothetical protein
MGNADFREVMTGPVVEVQVGKVFLLARGGYQNSNSLTAGPMGGSKFTSPSNDSSIQPTPTRETCGLADTVPVMIHDIPDQRVFDEKPPTSG